MDVGSIEGFFTVTEQVPFTPLPSFAVAVIVTLPALTPETTPLELTVAIAVFELDQVTVLSSAFEGVTVAEMVTEAPVLIFVAEGLREMPDTRIGVTVTVQVALLFPAFAVIVAVPTAFAVTVPPLTVATVVLELDQVTV